RARARAAAGDLHPPRRAEASGPRHRHLRGRLCDRALVLRVVPRARRAARIPLGRPHHGHAAVDPVRAVRHRADHRRDAPAAACGSASCMTPLEAEIRRIIEVDGPISIARYMELCLTHPLHGYYATRDPFGAAGDFITAPEVSQMFGELIGAWAATVWRL